MAPRSLVSGLPAMSTETDKESGTIESNDEPSRSGGVRDLLLLAVASLGIIYGDLGTSPLYTLNGIFPASDAAPSKEDAIGATSAVLWAITIVAVLKYALVALEFGNGSNEGGPFAVYSAIYPPSEVRDEGTCLTTYTTAASVAQTPIRGLLKRKWIQNLLFAWVLFGTCLTISDGLLTPAVSVTSAVSGIAVATTSITHSIVPISIAILVILFAIQPLGTSRVGFLFSPVLGLWFVFLAVNGIINVTKTPSIFRALDPSRAVMWFVRTGEYDKLSGVILAITGCEAFFANLGQFSKNSIRLSFLSYVYPALIFAYLGQGARLVADPETVVKNVFYNSIPGGTGSAWWWINFVIAIMASVIASQAMISATYSLVQQLSHLKAIPPIKLIHTSESIRGQVYAPTLNVAMLIGCIALIAGFGTSTHLSNAYGFAVSGVLFVTTSIIAIAIVQLKHLPVILAVAFFFVSGFFDALFFGATLRKVPEGAWFPLGLAVVMCTFLGFFSWAKSLETSFDMSNRQKLSRVIQRPDLDDDEDIVGTTDNKDAEGTMSEQEVSKIGIAEASASVETTAKTTTVITPILRRRTTGAQPPTYDESLRLTSTETTLQRLPAFTFFHNASLQFNGAPHSFTAFVRSNPGLPQVIVFFSIQIVGKAHTTESERYIVTRVRSLAGFYTAILALGYRDKIDLVGLEKPIKERIIAMESRLGDDGVARRVELVNNAADSAVTHILPHFHVTVGPLKNKLVYYTRKFFIETLYRRIKVNFDEYDQYILPENVLRIGVDAKL